MEYSELANGFAIRLERGKDVHQSLIRFAEKLNIKSAFYEGIGALENVEIAYFSLAKKECIKKQFSGQYELVSLIGNLTTIDGKPFLHTHVILADENYHTIAGHLFQGIITVTVEIFLVPSQTVIERGFDQKIGFRPMRLANVLPPQ